MTHIQAYIGSEQVLSQNASDKDTAVPPRAITQDSQKQKQDAASVGRKPFLAQLNKVTGHGIIVSTYVQTHKDT